MRLDAETRRLALKYVVWIGDVWSPLVQSSPSGTARYRCSMLRPSTGSLRREVNASPTPENWRGEVVFLSLCGSQVLFGRTLLDYREALEKIAGKYDCQTLYSAVGNRARTEESFIATRDLHKSCLFHEVGAESCARTPERRFSVAHPA